MNLSESFLSALDTLAAHKLRSALTMLGVIIGVAAVIALVGLGNGVQSSITGQLTSVGTNQITISPDMEHSGGYPPLSLLDVEALEDPISAPAITEVAAMVTGNREVTAGGSSVTTSVSGVTANYLDVVNLSEFQAGDGLTQADVNAKARVVVLGASVAAELFDGENPIGRELKIGGASYEIVGVLEEQGQTIGGNPDENVYLPVSTAQVRLYPERTRAGRHAISAITAQARSETEAAAAVEQINADAAQGAPPRGRRRVGLQHLQPDGAAGNGQHGDRHADRVPGRHCRHLAARRRHRHHEHHAGQRVRADARDRRA